MKKNSVQIKSIHNRIPMWFIILVILLSVTILHIPSSYADNIGAETSGCVGVGCPTFYPQGPSIYGTVQGQDEAYNVVIGGDWTLGSGAAEGEGRIVVLGDVNMNKSGGDINTGYVGAGSWVVPPDGFQSLIIGGDVNFTGGVGDNIIYGGVAGGDNIPLEVVYKGSKTGLGDFEDGSFPQLGVETNNPALDLTSYQAILNNGLSRGQCWGGLAQSANAQFTDSFGTYTFNSTDGASGLYVFNINQNLDPGYSGTIEFTNFPDDATILVNMLGVSRIFNTSTFIVNGTGMGTGTYTAEPVAEQILWNFPDATAVTIGGSSQFWGSVVAPATNLVIETSMNGRILAGGNLLQGTISAVGLELHNYPFNGSLPACDLGDLPDIGAGTGAGNYATAASDDGPSHMVTSTTPRLGACVDGESDGQQGATAMGDDSNATNAIDTSAIDATHVTVQGSCTFAGDDEDGVVAGAGAGTGGVWQDGVSGGSVDVSGTNGACLNGWIDWSMDGDFGDANEQVASDVALTGASQNVAFTVPSGSFSGNIADPDVMLYARFRVTQNCGTSDYVDNSGTTVPPTPNGAATNGEVEDYVWTFEPTAVSLQQIGGSSMNGVGFGVVIVLVFAMVTGTAVWHRLESA